MKCLLVTLLVLGWPSNGLHAQETNITSSGLNTAISSSDTTTFIDGGTRPGAGPNLFHSFGDFSVGEGHTALFRGSDDTANIFGRVTGGNLSNIFGTIDSATNFPQANLWLLNPAGFLFGPSASLNVGGSVNISTADYLKMTDGKQFFADPSKDSVLSMEPVAAFGFLGGTPTALGAQTGRITLTGGTVLNGQTLSLVGRDNIVSGARNPGIEMTGGTLSNAGGRVNLVSVDQPVDPVTGGEVGVSGTGRSLSLTPQNFSSLGEIRITGTATIDTSSNAAGPIVLRAGKLVMVGQGGSPFNNSTLKAQTGAAAGGGITITADTVDLQNGRAIDSSTLGAGAAGAIFLNAGTLRLNVNPDGTPIEGAETVSIISISGSSLSTAGPAGTVTISGPGAESTDAATLVALHDMRFITDIVGGTAVTAPATITIAADTLVLLSDPSALFQMTITTSSSGPAPAGAIAFHVNELRANVNPDGTLIGDLDAPRADIRIVSESLDFLSTAGPAGTVTISGPGAEPTDAATLVALHGVEINTSIGGGAASTAPGRISITADTVALSGSQIQSATLGSAPGGAIDFHVNELRSNVTPNGTPILGRNIQVGINIDVGSSPTAGLAGTVTISGPGAESTDAATLVALHSTVIGAIVNGGAATNPPGSITITADTVALNSSPAAPGRFPGRVSIGVRTIASAPAGNITFNVNNLRANVDTTGQPIAGAEQVRIRASTIVDTATIDTNGDGIPDTGDGIPDIVAAGNAGTITIQGLAGPAASEVRLANTELSTVGGNGTQPGNITIAANVLDLRSGTEVLANTIGTVPAGTITLKAGNLTAAGTLVSSSSGLDTNRDGVLDIRASGRGGDVTIQAGDVIVNPGTTFSAQSTGAGDAGSILLGSRNNILMRNSTITTTADQASGGNIKLTASNVIGLFNSTLSSSVKGQQDSNGGNISIDPIAVAIQNSQILAQANQGAGGSITIAASGAVLVDPNSQLSATAGPAGVPGSVDINAPIQVLGGTLVPLKVSYSQAALSGDRCAADPQGQFSSFVQTGRDGVPQIPGGYAPSPLLPLNRLVSISQGAQGPRLAAVRLGLDHMVLGASTQFEFQSGCRS